jgi:hypothetical protein
MIARMSTMPVVLLLTETGLFLDGDGGRERGRAWPMLTFRMGYVVGVVMNFRV